MDLSHNYNALCVEGQSMWCILIRSRGIDCEFRLPSIAEEIDYGIDFVRDNLLQAQHFSFKYNVCAYVW